MNSKTNANGPFGVSTLAFHLPDAGLGREREREERERGGDCEETTCHVVIPPLLDDFRRSVSAVAYKVTEY